VRQREVNFFMSRGNKLCRVNTALVRNFYINVRGLHSGNILISYSEGYIKKKFGCSMGGGRNLRLQSDVEFAYQFSICSGYEERQGNIHGVGRSQDLPDAN
jgi:hypothetical protein